VNEEDKNNEGFTTVFADNNKRSLPLKTVIDNVLCMKK